MLAKMIDKITQLAETKTFEINGDTYTDGSLTRIAPHIDRPNLLTVSGLDSIVKLIRAEIAKATTGEEPLLVLAKSFDEVLVMTSYQPDFSRNTLYRAVADTPGFRQGWREWETAIIEIRSLLAPNDGSAYLLDILSRINEDSGVTTRDNGVSQEVEARQGISLNYAVQLKPRVSLQPFRTFLEVAQPESEFLLRVDKDKGIGFFEADGGIWKLEAKRNIADYFSKALSDLVEAGKIVIMQ